MQVIARDPDQHIRSGGVHGNLGWHDSGKWSGSLGVDQNRDRLVPRGQCPTDHDVTLADEDTGHVPIRELTFLAKNVIAKSLKPFDPGIVGVGDRDPSVDHARSGGIGVTSRIGARRRRRTQ